MQCMERMRAEFGCYSLSEPPFEDWCPFARAVQQLDQERQAIEAEQLEALRQQQHHQEPTPGQEA